MTTIQAQGPGLNVRTYTNDKIFLQSQYDLDSDDLAFADKYTTLIPHFISANASIPTEGQTSQEIEILKNWTNDLYKDGEIGDPLLSSCKPAHFYRLLATLLEISLKACQLDMLSLDQLKGGFEYLLLPFLMPSLVGGIEWLASLLLETYPNNPAIDIRMTALYALLKPAKLQPESRQGHTALMYIVAKRLEPSLRHIQRLFPTRQDAKTLLDFVIQDRIDGERNPRDEVSRWAQTPNGGLVQSLRPTIRILGHWSSTASMGTDVAPSYSLFSQLNAALIVGVDKVLDMLIEEVENSSDHDVTLEIVAMLILSARHKKPDQGSSRLPMTLQSLLQTRFNEAAELAKTDMKHAVASVKLYKQVSNSLNNYLSL